METASNIIISILSSIIGGLFTFGGVWLTIKHEQKKERRNYLESIKPYLVVQHLVDLSKSEIQNIKTLSIPNDSAAPLPSLTQTSVVYHWENLVLTNVSNSTGIFAYIKINSSPYAFPTKSPIKPFETFQIIGNLISIFIFSSIESISLGVYDSNFNLYEYPLRFRIEEYTGDPHPKLSCKEKVIKFDAIDCQTHVMKN
ncbi:hypothetical protein ABI138_08985 [Faecalibacterium prausnitzii]|uniref:hypothetical protein n=1 Tax=Faecalibacterium TaxID=216851 RepID=UPI0032AEC9CF